MSVVVAMPMLMAMKRGTPTCAPAEAEGVEVRLTTTTRTTLVAATRTVDSQILSVPLVAAAAAAIEEEEEEESATVGTLTASATAPKESLASPVPTHTLGSFTTAATTSAPPASPFFSPLGPHRHASRGPQSSAACCPAPSLVASQKCRRRPQRPARRSVRSSGPVGRWRALTLATLNGSAKRSRERRSDCFMLQIRRLTTTRALAAEITPLLFIAAVAFVETPKREKGQLS